MIIKILYQQILQNGEDERYMVGIPTYTWFTQSKNFRDELR